MSSKLGETTVSTPFILTPAQYNAWQTRQSMARYYHQRNSAHLTGGPEGQREPFNVLDMSFALGPLEKIFGPGGLALRTQGSVQIDMGIKSNFTDNPALSLTSRRKTFFDFDQKIQATVQASVGDRLSFNMNYNTDATFAFDSKKNIKLQYEGKEDDIVKSIEAGNVSLTTGSSLIRGSTALFGIKSKLQFGKLTATALVSQQNSVSRSVSTKRERRPPTSQFRPTTIRPTHTSSCRNTSATTTMSLHPNCHMSAPAYRSPASRYGSPTKQHL